jgi:hypothetical protein
VSDNHGIAPDTVVALVEGGITVTHNEHGHEVLTCPVCNLQLSARSGWGPHKNGHLRAAGFLPPVIGKPRTPKPPKRGRPPKASPPPVSTRDVCLGALFGLVGAETVITVGDLDDIMAWVRDTEQLVERLRP